MKCVCAPHRVTVELSPRPLFSGFPLGKHFCRGWTGPRLHGVHLGWIRGSRCMGSGSTWKEAAHDGTRALFPVVCLFCWGTVSWCLGADMDVPCPVILQEVFVKPWLWTGTESGRCEEEWGLELPKDRETLGAPLIDQENNMDMHRFKSVTRPQVLRG